MNRVLFQSNSDEWATPQHIFDSLDAEFNFTVDACATEQNHKCDKYYTLKENGLSQDWGGNAYFAIRHIARLISGLKKHSGNLGTTTRLLCC